jgi:hypothetical protein
MFFDGLPGETSRCSKGLEARGSILGREINFPGLHNAQTSSRVTQHSYPVDMGPSSMGVKPLKRETDNSLSSRGQEW